ncbi:MAG: hypothetical protein M3383_06180 [Actinomycetota bacterium]|nr:hypothetical protein [Actinomycetota bacterium]
MEPEVKQSRRAAAVAATLIAVAGAAHLAFAITAISGGESLQANVEEIESNADFGKLYFSLGTWGVIMLIAGAGEIAASASFWRRTTNWRLAGLLGAYGGLAGSFFTLAIFRVAGLVTIAVLLVAIYLLSYHSGERPS